MSTRIVHPGEVLREHIEPLGITQVALADHLGMSFQRVNELLNGRRGVTVETAILLAQALPKTTPQFWLELQLNWDLETYPYRVKRVRPLTEDGR